MSRCLLADGCYSIYTVGDTDIFAAALQAVAAIFASGDYSSGAGIGALTAAGLMFSLLLALFATIRSQKLEVGHLFTLAIAYGLLFVPTGRVMLLDVTSMRTALVDNVPLGLALPGHFISTISQSVGQRFEQFMVVIPAQQNVSLMDQYFGGSHGGPSSAAGLAPLKILRGIQGAASRLMQTQSDLYKNLQNYVVDCAAGRAQFDEAQLRRSSNPLQTLLALETSGLSSGIAQGSHQEVGMTCQALRLHLNTQLARDGQTGGWTGAFTGAGNTTDLGHDILQAISAGVRLPNFAGANTDRAGTAQAFSANTVQTSFLAATGLSAASATDFLQLALFSSTINNALYCSNSPGMAKQLADCLGQIQAREQFVEDSAAAGSLFSRIMVHGMNIMLMMFYLLSPVVAIVMVASGAKGFAMAGQYLMFGVWSQSWLPVSTAVHFYIKLQLHGEMARLAGGLHMGNLASFYDNVSTKLALAGDLLASVPILTMSVLTGSMYAMASIANRQSARDHHNEKLRAPDLLQPAPLASLQAQYSGMAGSPLLASQGMSNPTLQVSSGISNTLEWARGQQRTDQANLSKTLQQTLADSKVYNQDGSLNQQFLEKAAAVVGQDDAGKLALALGGGREQKHGDGAANEQSRAHQTQQGANVSAGILPGLFGFKLGGGFSASTSNTQGQSQKTGQEAGRSDSAAVKTTAEFVSDWVARQSHSLEQGNGYSFAQKWAKSFGVTDSSGLQQQVSRVQSSSESARHAQQLSNDGRLSNTMKLDEAVRYAEQNPAFRRLLDDVASRGPLDYGVLDGTAAQSFPPEARRYAAAAMQLGRDGNALLRWASAGTGAEVSLARPSNLSLDAPNLAQQADAVAAEAGGVIGSRRAESVVAQVDGRLAEIEQRASQREPVFEHYLQGADRVEAMQRAAANVQQRLSLDYRQEAHDLYQLQQANPALSQAPAISRFQRYLAASDASASTHQGKFMERQALGQQARVELQQMQAAGQLSPALAIQLDGLIRSGSSFGILANDRYWHRAPSTTVVPESYRPGAVPRG